MSQMRQINPVGRPVANDEMLTLEWIKEYHAKHSWMPTYGEIASGMGYPSRRSAQLAVERLQARGYIERGDGARAMRIVKRKYVRKSNVE